MAKNGRFLRETVFFGFPKNTPGKIKFAFRGDEVSEKLFSRVFELLNTMKPKIFRYRMTHTSCRKMARRIFTAPPRSKTCHSQTVRFERAVAVTVSENA
jgi:hypothetical protein